MTRRSAAVRHARDTSSTQPSAAPEPAAEGRHESSSRTPSRTPWAITRLRLSSRHLLVAAVAALLGAFLLPLAPVIGDRPVVTWPQSSAAPESTALLLTNGTPERLDLRFSCAAAARAEAGGGLVLSTMQPDDPGLEALGLVVRVSDSSIVLTTAGKRYALGSSRDGECAVTVAMDDRGLKIDRNGAPVVVANDVPLPSVDGLITNVGAQSGATRRDLSVEVGVVDVSATSPTSLKLALILFVAVAALAVLVMMLVEDQSPTMGLRRHVKLRLPDAFVAVTLLVWTAIAPMTDDDGYYSAMARNFTQEGYIGNYYQMWNASFTPFTWLWQATSMWQGLGGNSVVWLRLPALAAGLITWFAIRRFASHVTTPLGASSRSVLSYVLAAAFLAWWLPYCMGLRPETLVAMCAALALLLVAVALETGRLSRAALAAALGGIAIAAHPTGFVVLAPLLVAAPRLWRLAHARFGTRGALVRVVAILASGTPAALAGFGDGTLHDFRLGMARFRVVAEPLNWTDEILRYQLLLSDIAMGSYAKRVPILLAIVLLLWFTALHVAGRVGGTPLPLRTSLAGWSLLISFLLLWITPSKWTHHFGSLSGVGPTFVALLLLTGIPVVRRLMERYGGLGVLPWVFGASLVPPITLALQGPNAWAYWWDLGMPYPNVPPTIGNIDLGSPAVVVAAVVVAGLVVWLWMLRTPTQRPVWPFFVSSLVVVGVLGGTVTYLIGTFAVSAMRTVSTYSPGAANVVDPLGCSASKAVSVYDDRTAKPLETAVVARGEGPPDRTFVPAGGYWPASPPPGGAGDGPTRKAWGSFTDKREANVGEQTSDWYALPKNLLPGQRVVIFLSGRADGVSNVTAEFGRRTDSGVTATLRRPIHDRENSTAWRADVVATAEDVSNGADVVRLMAYDGETTRGGWLAFTAPEVQDAVPLHKYIQPGSAVTISWQFALLFPCLDQLKVRHGITEVPEYAVTWPFGVLQTEATWQVFPGGLTGTAARLGSLVAPATYLTDHPDVDWGHVYRFRYEYSRSAYDVTIGHETVPGWRGVVPDRVTLSSVRVP